MGAGPRGCTELVGGRWEDLIFKDASVYTIGKKVLHGMILKFAAENDNISPSHGATELDGGHTRWSCRGAPSGIEDTSSVNVPRSA